MKRLFTPLFVVIFLFGSLAFSQDQSSMTKDDHHEFQMGGRSMLPEEAPAQRTGPAGSGNSPVTSTQKLLACGTPSSLATPYNTNNGQRGCMFDIVATNSVTINCFDANLYSGTTADYEIWYRPSTHVGNQNSNAGWTQLGTVTALTSAGNNVPTAIPITFSVTIPAGQTYAFYVTNTFGGGTSYTDGTAVGNLLASNADIRVNEGVGKSYPFGLTFTVRNFNGHIYYGGAVLDETDLSVLARPTVGGILVGWTSDEHTGNRGILERAVGAADFEALRPVALDASDPHYLDHNISSGNDYRYRIRYSTPDGQDQFSNISEVVAEDLQSLKKLYLWPSPANATVNAEFVVENPGNYKITVLNLMGQEIAREDLSADGPVALQTAFDTRGWVPGTYIMSISGPEYRKVKKFIKQ